MKVFGIDISAWQAGYPYDAANKEGVKFAILRAGYGRTKDNQFETHYVNAKRLGWGVGAYWYLYARTVDDAKAEARAFLKAIAGKQFDYPIYLDIEDPSVRQVGRNICDAMVRAFGEIIESAGYYFGVYTNIDWYRNVLSGPQLNSRYDWWIACWSTGAPTGINYGLWQFGGEVNYIRGNKVAGVVTDQNYAVKDYPKMIREMGLNGFPKITKPNEGNKKKTPKEIANEVIQGKWGNGLDRKNKLEKAGYNYNEVQSIVNTILGTNNNANIKYYTIKKGDTLYSIAIANGTTIGELQKLNNIKNIHKIYAGHKIRVK